MQDNPLAEAGQPGAFLALPPEACGEDARVFVLPLPYEATVSYGGGAARGPAALLAASAQVELHDRRYDAEPALDYGIRTLPSLAFPAGQSAAAALESIAVQVARQAAAAPGRVLLPLGGEHTVSAGVFEGLARAHGGPIEVVHIDAHADLRDRYEDNPLSHACVLRRIAEHPGCGGIHQFGIRSVCPEEVAYIRSRPGRIRTWYAEEFAGGGWREELGAGLAGKKVFLTFDVDGLDPAVVPGTGTPEPDGLAWRQVLELAETVAGALHATGGRLLALDCVEAAPIPGLHHSEFAVAKLLYWMLNAYLCPARPDQGR